MGESKQKSVSVRMSDDLRKRIENLASEAGSDRSKTIIALIEDGFESRKYSVLDEINDDLKDIKSNLQEVKKALDSYSPVMQRFRKYLSPAHKGIIVFKYAALFVAVLVALLLLMGILKFFII
ncbi:hypothetical protein B5F40_10615 [Gordonibacter sp. An230]|uniref:hypothetical protein n=1 Tax=Gordonibacter sp. An230 TaxID=1965592 RepID=UPI000B395202|nr:hypothetical protein [Gordonibacter sp. An230]OUO89550.1 hypothetical protein B5F40_10615 [Gordonibacter sp. An230]